MTVENRLFRTVARWIMRVEAAGNVLRLVLFGGTFLSTGLTALQQYGYAGYAWPFIALTGVGTLLFAYSYAEYGVYNQKSRDMADAGDNYSGPTMLMDARIEAQQLAYLGYVMQNGQNKSIKEIQEEMQDLTEREWASLRNGVDLTEIKQ